MLPGTFHPPTPNDFEGSAVVPLAAVVLAVAAGVVWAVRRARADGDSDG